MVSKGGFGRQRGKMWTNQRTPLSQGGSSAPFYAAAGPLRRRFRPHPAATMATVLGHSSFVGTQPHVAHKVRLRRYNHNQPTFLSFSEHFGTERKRLNRALLLRAACDVAARAA
jgi:hypothetical protein